MIKTFAMLAENLQGYARPKAKISRMAANGEIFPIVKGLYETDKATPGYLLAGSICGPSYISFDYALAYYGLIPEAVKVVTCATFEKKKTKTFHTPFGTFTYRDVPSKAFPLGVNIMGEGDYFYRIAAPEKAICDKLYTLSPVANQSELYALLTDDLRIDSEELKKLDLDKIRTFCEAYCSTNVKKLCLMLRRMTQC